MRDLIVVSCLIVLFLMVLFFIPSTSFSMGDEELKEGLSFSLSLGGVYGFVKSNNNMEERLAKSLYQDGEQEETLQPFGSVDITYKFSKDAPAIFYSFEGVHTAGFIQPLVFGTARVGLLYSDGKTWTDPYVTGTNRSKTDTEDLGALLAIEGIFEFIDVSVISYDHKIDNDVSGASNSDLKREGRVTQFDISMTIPISENFFVGPGYGISEADMDGKSYSYEGQLFMLEQAVMFGNRSVILELTYEEREYEKIHPTFGKKRDDKLFSGSIIYSIEKFLGYDFLGLYTILMFEFVDSNIEFYDESSVMAGGGFSISI